MLVVYQIGNYRGMKGVMESVQHTFIETHFDFFLEKERFIKIFHTFVADYQA